MQHGSSEDTKTEVTEKLNDVDTLINQSQETQEVTENYCTGKQESQALTFNSPQAVEETVTGLVTKTEKSETTEDSEQLPEKPETKSAEKLATDNTNQAVHEKSSIFTGVVRKFVKPGYIEIWLQDGISLLDTGKIHEAIGVLKKVIKADPENTLAWGKLGTALSMQGRNSEALNALRETINLSPNDIDAWHNLEIVLKKLGQKEEAKKAKEMEKQLLKH